MITLITGGARSGKSDFAEKLAKEYKDVLYIATAVPFDDEMKERIKLHKLRRPSNWHTYEGFENINEIIYKNSQNYECILLDCVTILITNLIFNIGKDDIENIDFKYAEDKIYKEMQYVVQAAEKNKSHIIFVTNEIGLGIIPENKLSRHFRDLAGKVNCMFSEKADNVYFVVSGIPVKIK